VSFKKQNIFFLFFFLTLIFPSNSCNHATLQSVSPANCMDKGTNIVKLTGTPGMIMTTTHCNDYIFDKVPLEISIKLFVLEYSREFDIDKDVIWKSLSGLVVEVSATPREVYAAYDTNGKLIKNATVSGLALSPRHIWVEIRTSQIWTSSLIHELVHIVIWHDNLLIHGDPDHEGPQYSGWTKKHTQFIHKMNRDLSDLDI